jgi:hypothetical protein
MHHSPTRRVNLENSPCATHFGWGNYLEIYGRLHARRRTTSSGWTIVTVHSAPPGLFPRGGYHRGCRKISRPSFCWLGKLSGAREDVAIAPPYPPRGEHALLDGAVVGCQRNSGGANIRVI